MDAAAEINEDAILQEQLEHRQAKADLERAVVLRVYNYFRIVLAFFLLIIFFEVPNQTFVGTLEPRWFQLITFVYLALNVAVGMAALISSSGRFTNPTTAASIVVLDIFFMALLLVASGGVDSGLGYLLVFPVAFGSVMLGGQLSAVFPAVATVNSISVELYVHQTGAIEGSQHFFEAAMLGISFFAVNFFFQYVAKLVADREEEVVSLEALDRMHRIAERSRRELEVANARFVALLRSTIEGVVVLARSGEIIFANERASKTLELDNIDLVGSNITRFLIDPLDPDEDRMPRILQAIDYDKERRFDTNHWQTARGEVFMVDYSVERSRDPDGELAGVVVLFRNVTEERENEERAHYLANYDALTGLANRTNFKEVLSSTLFRARRSGSTVAILIIDTDHFTAVNEDKGQEAGDEMLKVVADRLRSQVREGDLVARMHGDQFAIMLADLDEAEHASLVAEKVNLALAEPITIDGGVINTSASIGITVMGADQRDADELLSAATSAMDNAKSQGRNTFRFYQADIQKKADEKRRIQMMLRSAIENNEFKLMFQPIVSIRESRIYSSEALIRWFPTNSDPVGPDVFIPIAEESGQIITIGSWVLQSVFDQLKDWKEIIGNYPSIAINVSTKQLRDQEFRNQFQDIVATHQMPVEVVEMELTETGVMEDPETSMRELIELRQLGVKISIDDFGTGYSSLDYLRRLPLDLLKIDQSFTRGIGVSENDEEIVRVMIRMAHAMGLGVICEGVETREQLDFLREHDCDYCQGYYFSKPRTVEDLTELFIAERENRLNIMDGT